MSSGRAQGELAYFDSPSPSWLGWTCDVSSPGYSYKVMLVRSSNVPPHVDEETRGAWDPRSNVASELALCQILSITTTVKEKTALCYMDQWAFFLFELHCLFSDPHKHSGPAITQKLWWLPLDETTIPYLFNI